MKVLIKQAAIISSSSPFNGQAKDILITDGYISQVAAAITEEADTVIEGNGLCASIGWMDIFAHCGDPGQEFKETIETCAAAAAAGGFTDILVMPNTNPVVHSKSQVEYIVQKAAALPVNIYPLGAVTRNAEGKELAEMYDMRQSGAVAFSDGKNAIQSPGILLKALQYVKAFDGVVLQLPDDKSINDRGLVNEGIISTQLGLPGKPAIAEELMVARDIELLRYTGSKLHITGVSTQKSIELIAKAKAEGLNISCSVTPYHVAFCDEDLQTYDTNLKVNPPLRSRADMQAVSEALFTGVIDGIASHHIPQDWDSKTCEFEYAANGMGGFESLFGAVNANSTGKAHTEKLIDMLTIAPRNLTGLPVPEIKVGEKACLTLFNTTETYTFRETMIRSRSKNYGFTGKAMKGRVIGIINGTKTVLN